MDLIDVIIKWVPRKPTVLTYDEWARLKCGEEFWDVPDDGVSCSELADSPCVSEMHGMGEE